MNELTDFSFFLVSDIWRCFTDQQRNQELSRLRPLSENAWLKRSSSDPSLTQVGLRSVVSNILWQCGWFGNLMQFSVVIITSLMLTEMAMAK